MKRLLCTFLAFMIAFIFSGSALAVQESPMQAQARLKQAKIEQMLKNAKPIELAFVFDGPSEKNLEVLKTFQQTITISLLPDYRAVFPKDLIFVGDWTEKGAKAASDKALNSRARMVISLGYMSSNYYSDKKDKKKYVVTIEQYGLRDFGNKFFNPIQQTANDFYTFKVLVPSIKKAAILMNENYYKTETNWKASVQQKLKEKNCDLNFVIVPVNSNLKASLAKIPSDVDAIFVTPLYNLTTAQRKEVYDYAISRKLPSYSIVGKEDVELGAMLGTSTMDVDKKIAEATSFNIHGVLHGNVVKNERIPFYDDKVIFYNSDTGEAVDYTPPLRLLNNSVTITHKQLPKYSLGTLIDALDETNLDIKRKQPTHAGQFTVAMDQILYSPDLVTNIIVKHKKLKFDKAEELLTRANTEYHVGNLFIDTLMLENMIKVQEESLQETRENLAMARVREKTGKCGYEEVFRWAGEVSEQEKKLLAMQADYKNLKVTINKLLNKDQKSDFAFVPLTASDPAFFTTDLHIIDHVRDPKKLGKFTDMLVEEAIYLSPETTKLKAAIAMKKAEMANYIQKFVLPNAKMSLEYGTMYDRALPYEDAAHNQLRSGTGKCHCRCNRRCWGRFTGFWECVEQFTLFES